jgi:hypothetical protein
MPVLPQNRVTAAARKREEDEAVNYGCSLFGGRRGVWVTVWSTVAEAAGEKGLLLL